MSLNKKTSLEFMTVFLNEVKIWRMSRDVWHKGTTDTAD
jgi:hypothetical protein